MPDDPFKQANVLQRMYETDTLMEKSAKSIMYYLMMTPKDQVDQKHLEDKRKQLTQELVIWEDYLKDEYLCGSEFTMADVFFFPIVAFLVRGSMSLDSRPNLKKYYEKVAARSSMQASWPPHYKNTPPTETFKGI